jgi:hypothetical protein
MCLLQFFTFLVTGIHAVVVAAQAIAVEGEIW